MANIDNLFSDVLALPIEDRARLVRVLIDSLDADRESEGSPSDIEAAWLAEVARRDAELDEDPSLGIPMEDVLADAQRHLDEIRSQRQKRLRAGGE